MKVTETLQPAEPAEPAPAGGPVVDEAGPPPSPISRYLARHRDTTSTGAALLIFIAMVIYGQVTYGAILQPSTISNLLINNSHLVILAVGLTFVILTGGIDLSVGAVITFSSVAGMMLAQAGWNPYLVVVIMVLIGSLIGLVSGCLIEFFDMQPFIATLSMMFLARGLASTLSTVPERLDPGSPIKEISHQWKLIDGEKVNDFIVTPGVLVATLVVVVGLLVVHRTRFGRTVYAIGGSEPSANLMGLPVRRTKLSVYVISGTLAAIGGVVYHLAARQRPEHHRHRLGARRDRRGRDRGDAAHRRIGLDHRLGHRRLRPRSHERPHHARRRDPARDDDDHHRGHPVRLRAPPAGDQGQARMSGNPSDRYVIGVDFGTLSGRALVVHVGDGEELGSAVHEYRHGVMDRHLASSGGKLPPDWALQDPDDYRDVLRCAVPAAVAAAGVDPANVVGIATDFTASTPLPVVADGTPVCELEGFRDRPHAYVKLWKHHAAQPQADRINAVAARRGEPWLQRYGGFISSEWEYAKALEVLEEDHEVYERMDHWVEAADWIVWQLCGEYVRNACTAGYKGIWQDASSPTSDFEEALNPEFAGFAKSKLEHRIGALGDRAGGLTAHAAAWTGLPEGIAVAVGNVDAHVTAPAARALEAGQMLAIMGTSTCHVMNHDQLVEVPGMCGVVEGGILAGSFGYEAGQSGVGDIFAWYVDNQVPGRYFADADAAGSRFHDHLAELSVRRTAGCSPRPDRARLGERKSVGAGGRIPVGVGPRSDAEHAAPSRVTGRCSRRPRSVPE